MKKAVRNVIVFLLLLCLTPVLSSCAIRAYACDDYSDNTEEIKAEQDYSGKNTTNIRINEIDYKVSYSGSRKSRSTNNTFDSYDILTSDNDIDGYARYNSNTKELVFFTGITPLDKVPDIQTLTDEQLRIEAEKAIGEYADFTTYNTFTVSRFGYDGVTMNRCHLMWQVKRDMLCKIYLSVDINENNEICSFSKVNACSDELTKAFITNEERDKILKEKVFGWKKITTEKITIMSEELATYDGKDSIIYVVRITDKDGFASVRQFKITKK